jgi:hypothetical protein
MYKRIVHVGTFDETLSFQELDTNGDWSMSGNHLHRYKSDRINIMPYKRFLSERDDWFYYIPYNDTPALETKFDVDDIIPEPVLHSIRTGKCRLIFHFYNESFMEDHTLLCFHRFIDRITQDHGIPIKKIYWMREPYDGPEVYQDFLNRHNIEGVNFVKHPTFGETVIDRAGVDAHDVKKCRFIYLNRGARPPRSYLGLWLWKHGIDVNMSCSNDLNGAMLNYCVDQYDIDNEITEADKQNFLDLLPLSIDDIDLDTQHEQAISVVGNAKFLLSMERAGIYILSETLYEEPGRFMTEKFEKALLAQKPFIVLGQHRYIEMVRECGYKTFEPYIDETYDTISDHTQRLHAVCREISRLNNMDDLSFHQNMYEMQKIAEYNFNHYKSRPTPGAFMDELF